MKRLKFSKESCIGCQMCAQACSALHEGEYIPSKARIAIASYYANGGKELKYQENFCILCGRCAKKCPNGAIKLEEKLIVDAAVCVGCGACAEECPKKVIQIRDGKSVTCDTCDGNPACVSMCPHGALKYA